MNEQETKTYWKHPGNNPVNQVPDGAAVYFHFDGGAIQVANMGTHLRIHEIGGGIMAICPQASNAVHLKLRVWDTSDLKQAAQQALEALWNVPEVGHEYDDQHAGTHLRAAMKLREALEE